MSTPSALLQVMIAAARKVGRKLARDFGEVTELQVSKKGPADFVSAADTKSEEVLVEAARRPDVQHVGTGCRGVHGLDVDRVGTPDVVLPEARLHFLFSRLQ